MELSPELFVIAEGTEHLVEAIGDLSVSSTVVPEGNKPDGSYDGPPQEGYQPWQLTLS